MQKKIRANCLKVCHKLKTICADPPCNPPPPRYTQTHTHDETHTLTYIDTKHLQKKNTLVLLEIINKINAKESFCCAMLEDCASGGVAVKYGPTCLRFYVLFALPYPPPPAHFCIRPLDEQLLNGRRVRHSAPTSIPAPVATQPNPAGNPLSSFTMPRLSNEFPTKLWPTERARERGKKLSTNDDNNECV